MVILHQTQPYKFHGPTVMAIALACCALQHTAAAASEATRSGLSDPLMATVQPAPADAVQLEMATGIDYSVGDYGEAKDTSVISTPIIAKGYIGRLRLEGSLPYVSVKGPGQLVGGVIVTSAASTDSTRRSGVGDVNLSAGYRLNDETETVPSIEVSTDVKLGTAKTSIGTGETDYGLSANVSKSVSSAVMVFGTLGYSWLGSPSDYALKDGVFASGGINYSPASDQNYGLTISYREPIADGLDGQVMVSPYLTYRIAEQWGLTLYGAGGLNSSSPRAAAGLRLSYFPARSSAR